MQIHAAYSQVVGCEIKDCGSGGIVLGEVSLLYDHDGMTSHDLIANNKVHDVGQVMSDGMPIFATLVDHTRIAGNTVYDAKYSGISLGCRFGIVATTACDNVVASNTVYNVMQLLYDGGGIYLMGEQPGTVVCGNNIHDITSPNLVYANADTARRIDPVPGIYLDNGSGGITVYGNLIYDCDQAFLLSGFSACWDVESNLCVNINTVGVRLYDAPVGKETFAYNVFTWTAPPTGIDYGGGLVGGKMWLFYRDYSYDIYYDTNPFDPLYSEDHNVFDTLASGMSSGFEAYWDVREYGPEGSTVGLEANSFQGNIDDSEYSVVDPWVHENDEPWSCERGHYRYELDSGTAGNVVSGFHATWLEHYAV